ncbi:hypothetical protein PIB30_019623 [Stylosanthes scabra]|uniref:Uncharacterized protein n=1 Tax=Stylosanthes scabra TaxID=79078 RepID=A0ABU6R8L7_9FABA|nr:hypothetical protein [Stylosanthes scabra]
MGRKAKDKGKDRIRDRRVRDPATTAPGKHLELPTIAEENVSIVDNQILGFLQDLKQLIGRHLQIVAEVKSSGDSAGARIQSNIFEKKSDHKTDVIDVDCLPTRTLRDIISDVAAVIGVRKSGVVQKSGNNAGIVEHVGDNTSGTGPRPCKFVIFSTEDMNILYSIKQRYAGSPIAFWLHNRTEMFSEETPTNYSEYYDIFRVLELNRICSVAGPEYGCSHVHWLKA